MAAVATACFRVHLLTALIVMLYASAWLGLYVEWYRHFIDAKGAWDQPYRWSGLPALCALMSASVAGTFVLTWLCERALRRSGR